MEDFTKLCALALVSVLLIRLLRQLRGEYALLLSLAVVAVMGICLAGFLKPVLTFFSRLEALGNLDSALMTATLKTVGIGLLTQLSSAVCLDAGESAVAKTLELCGGAVAVWAAMPLLEAILALLQTMSGG